MFFSSECCSSAEKQQEKPCSFDFISLPPSSFSLFFSPPLLLPTRSFMPPARLSYRDHTWHGLSRQIIKQEILHAAGTWNYFNVEYQRSSLSIYQGFKHLGNLKQEQAFLSLFLICCFFSYKWCSGCKSLFVVAAFYHVLRRLRCQKDTSPGLLMLGSNRPSFK